MLLLFFFVGNSDSIKKEIGFDFSIRNPRLWTSENLLDFKRQIECALTSLLDLRISDYCLSGWTLKPWNYGKTF